MAGLTRPGTYVNESLLSTTTPINTTVAVGAFVGAATRGPTTPVRVQSWSDVIRNFGDFTGDAVNDTLIQAMFDALNNGARTLWAVRAAGSGAAKATLAFSVSNGGSVTAATGVEVSAVNPGTWGNDIYVEVLDGSDATHKNLVIRKVPTGATITDQQIVEQWNDVSLNPNDPRYLIALLTNPIGGSAWISAAYRTVSVAYTYSAGDKLTNSSVAGGSKLASGANGSAVTAAVMRDAVYTLDVVVEPFVLNLPGVTDLTTIGYIADYADPARIRTDNEPGRGDVFIIVDTDPGVSETTAATKVATYPRSDCLAAYYPNVVVNNPSNTTRSSTKLVPSGPAVLGRYMATDAARGFFKSPAGIIDGVLNGVLALDPAARLRSADLNVLHAASVNAIKTEPGVGVGVIFGMRTLRLGAVTQYISARRTLISVRAQLREATRFAISENNDSYLWHNLYTRADRILRELHTAGGLKGDTAAQAYFVICDESNNTDDRVENGEVHLQVGLALQRPAEFMILDIAQFAGGAAVITEIAA